MPTETDDFLACLSRRLGETPHARVQEFLRRRSYPEKWSNAELSERDRILAEAVAVHDDLVAVFRPREEAPVHQRVLTCREPRTPEIESDGRWDLWRDLVRARAAGEGDHRPDEWEPLVVRDLGLGILGASKVRIEFDGRLSRRALFSSIERIWPLMQKHLWLRATRPMDERNLELVRFVCLKLAPDRSWQERCEGWNRQAPEAWQYPDRRQFQSAFRRAEEALSGRKYGLAWFYEPGVRSGSLRRRALRSWEEFKKTASKGDLQLFRAVYGDWDIKGPEPGWEPPPGVWAPAAGWTWQLEDKR